MVDEIKNSERTSIYDLREVLRRRVGTDRELFEENVKVLKAYTVGIDSTNSPAVAGRANFIWVREAGKTAGVYQVFNPNSVPLSVGMPVLLKYGPKQPYRWQVYGIDWDVVENFSDYSGENFGVGPHSANQEWLDYEASYDPLTIYPRALYPLRAYPGTSGLLVSVSSHRYVYEGEVITYPGELDAVDLTSFQPITGYARNVVVYLDKTTNSLGTVGGSLLVDGTTLPPYPSLPATAILSAAVRIDGDQTSITEADFTDLRMVLTDTEASGALRSMASAESEIDYVLSNHELRIDSLDSSLGNEIQSLDDSMRQQLALIEAELDFALTMTVV